MTTTETIYPYDVKQTTGGHYQVFDKLGNLKQTSGYAVSAKPIDYKNGTTYTPSTITSYFKLKLPINAEIRKVTVQYRHYVDKLAISKGYPITTPTIIIGSKANSKTFNMKGNAATKTSTMRTATFTNVEVDVNSFFNNGNFRVQLKYSKNSTNNYGKVHLAYIRVKVEYVTPDFDVSMSKVSGGYNREELSLKATISNKNLTKGNPVVNISLPLGLSYVGVKGNPNGTVTQPQNRTLVWTPVVNRAGSVSVEIIVVPNVSYSSSDKVWTGSIAYTMPSFNRSRSLNVTVTERPPKEDESGTQEEKPPIEMKEVPIEVQKVYCENPFRIQLNLTEEEKTLIKNGSPPNGYINVVIYDDIAFETVSDNAYRKYDTGEWSHIFPDIFSPIAGQYSRLDEDGCFSFDYKITEWGRYYGALRYEDNRSIITLKTLILDCIPFESDLSTPNMTLLSPTEEETHRLGDGYTYTLQSDMTLNTSEDYVRNWYKNFRLGVFNNPIEANQHKYWVYKSEESSQYRDISIPSRYQLEDVGIRLYSTGPMNLIIDETTYDIFTTPIDMTFEEYTQSVTFVETYSSWEFFKIEIWNTDYTELLETIEYGIWFSADETLPIYQQIDDSTDYTALTDTEIFQNAEWWSETQAGLNTSNNVECQFTYDENYPLYIIYTGDYPEGDPDNNTVTFNEPCIIEDYEQRLTNGLFIEPIDDSIKDDGSLSTITMNAFDISNTIVLYDLPLSDNYGTNTDMAIRGIELTGEVEQTDRLILYAKLRSPTGESRQRSILIEDTNDFSIGGNGDLWGYNTLDMVNLEDWEIELTVSNNLDEVDGNLIFGNLQLNIYVERVEPSNIVCYINGEDLRYYGVFITDVSIPEGLQTDTRYLEVDGTDHNDPYNQSIRQKEIEIEFELGNDCDLQANTLSRRELAKLLVNDRDDYNRPIPNTIEFSHYPDIYWEYIMEKAIEDKIKIGSYTDGKVTLVVPAGTAYDKESTTTSNTGYVNGLATINPILIVKPTDEIITIREEVTGQEFHMGYSGEWNDKILEIDCEDRIVWLKTDEDDTDPINLNRYVDFNSDWFRLKGDFSFSGINCIIRTVDYQERW